ncbi:hypothetical protein P8452_23485 [Trifolium repens]|nr:hypothetical protein P8452_23485 [Trifolium repens]
MSSHMQETTCWTSFMLRRNTAEQTTTTKSCYGYFWTKPARETLKCNVDTACYDEQIYCVGACIRDDKGNFIEAIMRNYSGKPLIAEVGAHGVLEVLQWIDKITTPNLELLLISVVT